MSTTTVATFEDDERHPDLTEKALALAADMSQRKIMQITVTTDTGDAFTMQLRPTRGGGNILNRIDWPL